MRDPTPGPWVGPNARPRGPRAGPCCCWLSTAAAGCCGWLLLLAAAAGCCCWLLLLAGAAGCCCWVGALGGRAGSPCGDFIVSMKPRGHSRKHASWGDRHKLAGTFGPDLTAGKLYQLFGGRGWRRGSRPLGKTKLSQTKKSLEDPANKTGQRRPDKPGGNTADFQELAGAFHVWSGALDDASAGGRRLDCIRNSFRELMFMQAFAMEIQTVYILQYRRRYRHTDRYTDRCDLWYRRTD